MVIAFNSLLIFFMVAGILLASRIYNLGRHLFRNRINALGVLCISGVSFLEYELSRETNYFIALKLGNAHILLTSVAICFSVVSIWASTLPFPKGKLPFVDKLFLLLNLSMVSFIWVSEAMGNHVISDLHPFSGGWLYEIQMDRFIVKIFIAWYALQVIGPVLALLRFYYSCHPGKMKTWALYATISSSVLFAGVFYFFLLNDLEAPKAPFFVSPAILFANALFAYSYTNFKLFKVLPINAFDNILESMSNEMIIFDLNFKIRYINKVFRKKFGMQGSDEIPYFNLNDIARDFQVENWDEDFQIIQNLKNGQKFTKEYELKLPDSSLFYQATFSPIYNKSHIKTGFLVIGSNITQLKESEAQLKQYTRKLEQSNSELERFAHIASHDLKTPLRNIANFLNLIDRRIKKHYDDPKLLEYLNFAINGAKQMNHLIVDVLEFSKIGSSSTKKELVDLNEAVRYACHALKPIIEEKNAKVYWEDLPMLIGDYSRLVQLFQNLIENGIKYNKSKKPRISVGYSDNGEVYQLSVKDNGIGINEAYNDQVFEMFKRLHNSTEYEGTGIGLAVCKKIVTQLGGTIRMESTEGLGSNFIISLPKSPPQEKQFFHESEEEVRLLQNRLIKSK